MADDTQQGGEPTTTKPTAEQVQAAAELLKAHGQYVLGHEDFARVKGAAAKEADARAAAYQAELEALKGEHKAAAERLRAIDDEGKSEKQRLEDQRTELQRLYKEREHELETARKAHSEAMEANRALMVEQKLSLLLTGAVDPDLALLAAKHRLPGKLTVNEQGRLRHEDLAGFETVGEAAEAVVKAWWIKQTALRAPSMPAGPPTSGAVTHGGASDMEPFNPPPGSMAQQLEYAKAYKAREMALRGQR